MNQQDKITILRGPDRVRKRPAVVFSDVGAVGATVAIKNLLKIFVAEAAMGHCNKILFTVNSNDSITVKSFDRGFVLDETVINDHPVWYYDFCELFYPAKDKNSGYTFNVKESERSLYGADEAVYTKLDYEPFFDITCIQFASEFFRVKVLRDGFLKELNFEKGLPLGDMVKTAAAGKPYTEITIKLDFEVFGSSAILHNEIVSFLRIAAATLPELICEINLSADEKLVLNYKNGLTDYIEEHTEGFTKSEFYISSILANGKDRYNTKEYTAKIKVVLCFAKEGSLIECIHNHEKLAVGGAHLENIKKKLLKYLGWNFCAEPWMKTEREKILNNLVLAVQTECEQTATDFETTTKQSIKNRMIIDMAYDVLNDKFSHWLKGNVDDILKIFERLN